MVVGAFSAQLTSCLAVASCGLLPGPAHESFYVVASCGLLPRTTRPGPRVRTAFLSVASLPLRDTCSLRAWSAPLTECSVILSEASLRAKSKDPHLVASSAWVADPSQVPMPCGHHRGMKMPRKRPPRDLFHRKLRMTSSLWRTRNVRDAVQS